MRQIVIEAEILIFQKDQDVSNSINIFLQEHSCIYIYFRILSKATKII